METTRYSITPILLFPESVHLFQYVGESFRFLGIPVSLSLTSPFAKESVEEGRGSSESLFQVF